MLKRPGEFEREPVVRIADADRSDLFGRGLEYNPPARGVWNIVHMGLLVPESHQVYVCAQGCLRGVTLTVAENGTMDRLSWVSLSEEDMFDATLESDVVDGVAEVIEKLEKKPRAVMIFLSCMHLFAGADYEVILDELRERFSDIEFIDCYMTPTMRETFSPVVWLIRRMCALIKPLPLDRKYVSLIGCDRATDEESEMVKLIRQGGFELLDINSCKSYDEYMELGKSALVLTYMPTAVTGAEELCETTGAQHLHIPNAFDTRVIRDNLLRLCGALGIDACDFDENEKAAKAALDHARQTIGDTAIAIDFTAVTRPFELALVLCEHGFNVKTVIADEVGEDADAFDRLAKEFPDIEICSAKNVNMLYAADGEHEKTLAIGQKAAWFFATDSFVDIVSNGGLYGFEGIKKLAALMEQAYLFPKDRKTVIQQKGWGCECNAQI